MSTKGKSNWGWAILLALLALFGLKGTSGATPPPTPTPTPTPTPGPQPSITSQPVATPEPTPSTSAGGINLPGGGVSRPPEIWVGWTLVNASVALQDLLASKSGLWQTAWIGNKGGLALISAIDCYIYKMGTPKVIAQKVKPQYLPLRLDTGQKVAQKFQSGPITEAGDYEAEVVVTAQSGKQSFSSIIHVYVWTAPPVT